MLAISLMFSGEEGYGRYLDLYANHTMYNNLRRLPKRLTYLQYLDVLLDAQNGPVHRDLQLDVRTTKEFEALVFLPSAPTLVYLTYIFVRYMTALHAYLISFTKRVQPLSDTDRQQKDTATEFDELWDQNKIEGWEATKQNLKEEASDGIWCSACQKSYSKQTVYDAHLKSKKHEKAVERQAAGAQSAPVNPNGIKTTTNGHFTVSKFRNAARLTHLVSALLRLLTNVLTDTKSNVERRFSLTAHERELESEEASKAAVSSVQNNKASAPEEEEEEEKIYNPLKLPLGWDGKPIPYWLYKLHGLGVEYRCEICSDHVYMGRKNFDRHFQVGFRILSGI